jgi:uncharacterized membrane protein
MSAKTFFTESQRNDILQAIIAAELNTSGEIRVHLDTTCPDDPMEQAVTVFESLKMHETELRNGVLFYLAIDDKKFAILGDQGINDAVPVDFWDSIRDEMTIHFRQHDFAQGLCKGIARAGEKLKTHFPFHEADTNELSNDISFRED